MGGRGVAPAFFEAGSSSRGGGLAGRGGCCPRPVWMAPEGGAGREESPENQRDSNNGNRKGKEKVVEVEDDRREGVAKECRICHDDDDESDMEAPCACTGTIKFAHRKCIQRWCNRKGHITCEICKQVYRPNYTVPRTGPGSESPDAVEIDIREDTRIHLHDAHILAISEQEYLHAEYEYAAENNSGLSCCRFIALVVVLFLLVRHVLIFLIDTGIIVSDDSDFLSASLQCAGFLFPCYVVAHSCSVMQNQRRRQL